MSACFIDFFGRIAQDRRGVTALEYAMLAMGIISGVALGAAALNHGITQIYTTLLNDLKAAGA